jgi:alkylated DNA nucleotide flippase Atl1
MGYGLMASATGRSRALRYVGGAKELTEMEETIWWLESHMYN